MYSDSFEERFYRDIYRQSIRYPENNFQNLFDSARR